MERSAFSAFSSDVEKIPQYSPAQHRAAFHTTLAAVPGIGAENQLNALNALLHKIPSLPLQKRKEARASLAEYAFGAGVKPVTQSGMPGNLKQKTVNGFFRRKN